MTDPLTSPAQPSIPPPGNPLTASSPTSHTLDLDRSASTSEFRPNRRWTWREWLLLSIILTVGAALRVARVSYDSLSFDEQWHLELSTGRGSPHVRLPDNQLIPNAPAVTSLSGAPPWYSVWTHMDFVVHPPLYCTLLRLWRDAFGESDAAARAFSIVCTLVAIACMFAAAREVNGLTAAGWAGIIFAVAPTQIFMAQQVRGYDLLLALGMAAVLALVRFEKSDRLSKLALVSLCLCVLGMMLTHYFAVGACAAMGVYVLIRLRKRKLAWVIGGVSIAAVVFLVAWGPLMLQQIKYVGKTADPWLAENAANHINLTLGRLASWGAWLVVRDDGSTPIPMIISVIVLLAPALLLHRRRDLLLWYLWLAGTLGFVAMLDLTRSTAQLKFVRYVSLAAPAVFVLFAAMVARLPIAIRHVAPALVVIVSLFSWRSAYANDDGPVDWRLLGQIIDQHAAKDEVLIFYPGLSPEWHREIFYLGSARYSHQFPRPIIKLSAPASEDLMKQIPGKTAWLISGPLKRGLPVYPPEALVPPDRVGQVIPGAEVIDHEQYIVPDLAICTHVRLGGVSASTLPGGAAD